MDVEEAIEEAQKMLDEHEYASSRVSPEDSVEFYRALSEHCDVRADEIQSEIDAEGD